MRVPDSIRNATLRAAYDSPGVTRQSNLSGRRRKVSRISAKSRKLAEAVKTSKHSSHPKVVYSTNSQANSIHSSTNDITTRKSRIKENSAQEFFVKWSRLSDQISHGFFGNQPILKVEIPTCLSPPMPSEADVQSHLFMTSLIQQEIGADVSAQREFRLKSELLALEEGKTIRYLGTDRQVSDRILLVLKVVPGAGLVDTAKAIQKRYLEIVICSSHHADQSWTDYCLNSHGEGHGPQSSENMPRLSPQDIQVIPLLKTSLMRGTRSVSDLSLDIGAVTQ